MCVLTQGLQPERVPKGFVLRGEDTQMASKVMCFVLLVCGLGRLDGGTFKANRKLDKVPCHQLYELLCSCSAHGFRRELVTHQFTV